MPDESDPDKILEKWAKSCATKLGSLDPNGVSIQQGYNAPDLVQVVATVSLYRSSKRLEKLTKTLIILTVLLAVLTAILMWRTFVPPTS
jgi:hypothetical protein